MPILIRLLPYILPAVIAWSVAWFWQGARWDADVSSIRAEYAKLAFDASEAARNAEKDLAERARVISSLHYTALRQADVKEQALRRDVASGAVQLRIYVQRAATAEGQLAARGRLDTRETAVLDSSVGPDYHALRDNIIRTEKQLAACIDTLIDERK